MSLQSQISKAESLWFSACIRFLEGLYQKYPLPSHDHYHHQRVWNYAKDLLKALEGKGMNIPDEFIESLLLSSLFHDSGMTIEKGEKHGKAGVQVFREFLSNQDKRPFHEKAIFDAIEYHEDKSFLQSGRLIRDGELKLLAALHIADDLDAFGNIGVYRYAEIYLLRGIPFEDLGLKIIANISGRYGNFMSNCSRFPQLVITHAERYRDTESFFRHYNLQIRKLEEDPAASSGGPLHTIKEIYRQVMLNARDIPQVIENISSSTDDSYTLNYLSKLKAEI